MPSLPRSPFGRRSARARAAAEISVEANEPRAEIVEAPGLRWVNIERPRSVDQAWLEERFEFHPLDYEDVFSRNQRPKVDEYDDYLFIVLHFPRYDKSVGRLNAASPPSDERSRDGVGQMHQPPRRPGAQVVREEDAEALRPRVHPDQVTRRAGVAEHLATQQVAPAVRRAQVVEPPAQAPRLRPPHRLRQLGQVVQPVAGHHPYRGG